MVCGMQRVTRGVKGEGLIQDPEDAARDEEKFEQCQEALKQVRSIVSLRDRRSLPYSLSPPSRSPIGHIQIRKTLRLLHDDAMRERSSKEMQALASMQDQMEKAEAEARDQAQLGRRGRSR